VNCPRRRDVRRSILCAGFPAALTLLGAPACLMPAQRREDTLQREVRLWNDDQRWGRWDAVMAAMPEADGRALLERVELVEKELVLGDFELTGIRIGDGSESATVTVKLDWYWKRDMLVRTTHLEQRWEFQQGRWLMVGQRRARGERLPLVPEPIDKIEKPTPVKPAPVKQTPAK
jgi:hypothetical protein